MKKIKYIVLLSFSFLFIISCSKAEFVPAELTNNPLSSSTDIAVNEVYETYKDKLNTVGLSIGFIKGEDISFYGYGETKKGNGTIPNENTFYEIGSITKTFTAIMAVQMLLEQDSNVDTPIKSYLPDDLPTLNRNGIEVNFKHLLTHTSGLARMPSNFKLLKNPAKAYSDYDDRRLYSFLENARLHADPFTQYSYSNAGMGLVGTILERNYDLDYGDVLRQKLTGALNLSNTSAYFDETNLDRWAQGYGVNGKEADYWKSLNALDGAGVIKSTMMDLLTYASANLNPPESRLGDAIKMTHTLYFNEYEDGDFFKIRSCLGWHEYINKALPEKTFLWHGGDTAGFSSTMILDLEEKNALVLLFNTQVHPDERQLFISDLLKLLMK